MVMKKNVIVFTLLFLVFFSSCKKEVTPTTPVVYGTESFKVNIGGNLVDSDASLEPGFSKDRIKNTTNFGNVAYMSEILIERSIGVGAHTLDSNLVNYYRLNVFDYSTSQNDTYESISGSLTITKHDTQNNIIEGTFNTILRNDDDHTDIIYCTDGSFYVLY